jgi:hypothetical protein
MPTKNLIGTAGDQVSANGMLGELAFQNKESINFTGGSGALSELELNPIYKEITATAVDVFVYDTRKDSDSGAWRKRTQGTSWYSEELNTATRGSRREFPSVAVIVVTTGSLTIYDGDEPTLPMWMVFQFNGAVGSLIRVFANRTLNALNGIICMGVNSGAEGLRILRFVADQTNGVRNVNDSGANGQYATFDKLSNRNVSSYFVSSTSSPQLVNSLVNDVAMTVLPNASIDPATGLPTPTIAVATQGGVSVIKDDLTVVNYTDGSHRFTTVSWMSPTRLFAGSRHVSGVVGFRQYVLSYPLLTVESVEGFNLQNDGVNWSTGGTSGSGGGVFGNAVDSLNNEISIGYAQEVARYHGLNRIAYNTTPNNSLAAYITSKYNTGWMPGDIKGAWLSDTTQETVVGTELVTNGTFDTNTSSWGSSGATLSVVSGALRLTNIATNGRAFQDIPTIPGKTYVVTVRGVNRTSSTYRLEVRSSVETVNEWTSGSVQRTFVAVLTTTRIELYSIGGIDVYAEYDDVTVRQADPDRSVNNRGLQVFGNISKTPVAANTDLVAYSGFSSSSYLEQPYNSALDFGTGDFCVMGWLKCPVDSTGVFLIRSANSGGNGLFWYVASNGVVSTRIGTNGTVIERGTVGVVDTNNWIHFTVIRQSGIVYRYLNSKFDSSFSLPGDINTPEPLQLGEGNVSMALWRISATAPSDAQIKKMYEDEKVLFQDNSKAVLYGSSDAVTALAYDDSTNLLHAGTSSGRSVFQGLRRVDYTTTPVGAAISASNGLVVEE